jgi:hypothetical protein
MWSNYLSFFLYISNCFDSTMWPLEPDGRNIRAQNFLLIYHMVPSLILGLWVYATNTFLNLWFNTYISFVTECSIYKLTALRSAFRDILSLYLVYLQAVSHIFSVQSIFPPQDFDKVDKMQHTYMDFAHHFDCFMHICPLTHLLWCISAMYMVK